VLTVLILKFLIGYEPNRGERVHGFSYHSNPEGGVAMTPPTDHALLEAARRGDRSAVTPSSRDTRPVSIDRHEDVPEPEDAKTFFRDPSAMARNVGDFREESSISTWLYSIARGFCVKKRRKASSPERLGSSKPFGPADVHRLLIRGARRRGARGQRAQEALKNRSAHSIRCTGKCSSCGTSRV
jgi:hypothetical protein